jgi:chromosomal replication initiation ATPase DnaA
MSAAPRQLALALGFGDSFAREDFLAGPPNAAALALIERWPDWPSRAAVMVGPEGSGKSHLAAIWAERSGARFVAGRALVLADVPAQLATGALVLEDLGVGGFDERAVFHLLNLVNEQAASVLITAQTATWAIALPDLASRLRALPVVTLAPPDDALLRAVLVKLFADRQIAADEALVAFLTSRIERSFAAARRAVASLDQEALRQHRPVTRVLAAELFRNDEGK